MWVGETFQPKITEQVKPQTLIKNPLALQDDIVTERLGQMDDLNQPKYFHSIWKSSEQ